MNDTNRSASAETAGLAQAIAALEEKRAALGDAVVNAAIAPLRERLSALAARPDSEGERRVVTVLFADFEGYTSLVSRMDPERVRELINPAFEALVPHIEKYGGTIDKFIGDEVMALFGAPVAHEDDARRACLAALDMAAELERYNARRGSSLRLHFGMGTGLVVAGDIGSSRHRGYSAVGNAVNRAARLASKASGGLILVDAATRALAGPGFAFEELPPVELKGFPEPTVPYRLTGLDPTAPGGRGRRAEPFLPFVGRESEMARMLEAWNRSPTAFVALVGEPGIGKTRLADEFARRAAETGPVRVVGTRSQAFDSSTAYRLWSDLLDGLAGVEPADTRKLRNEKLWAFLGQAMPGSEARGALMRLASMEAPPPGDAGLFDGSAEAGPEPMDPVPVLAGLLGSLAGGGRLLFVCDDAQWCDHASLDILYRLAAGGAPACWLLLSREIPAVPPGLAPVVVRLGPLDDADGRTLASLRTPGADDRAVSRALAMAGGNPLFLEELLRQGLPEYAPESPSGAQPDGPPNADAPSALAGFIMARIDALPPAERETVRVASILGDRFRADILAAMTERPDAEGLVRDDILVAEPDDSLSFRHGLLRDAVYRSFIDKRRRELHARAAEATRELYPDYARQRPEILARHWHRAGEPRRALPYYRHAGENHFYRGALPAAAALLETGLDLARESGSSLHIAELQSLMGLCRAWGPDPGSAAACLDEAVDIYRGLANRSREIALSCVKAFALVRSGALAEAETLLSETSDLAERTGSYKDQAVITATLAGLARGRAEFARALPLAERALAIADYVKNLYVYRPMKRLVGECRYFLGRASGAVAPFGECAEACSVSREPALGLLAEIGAAWAAAEYTGDADPAAYIQLGERAIGGAAAGGTAPAWLALAILHVIAGDKERAAPWAAGALDGAAPAMRADRPGYTNPALRPPDDVPAEAAVVAAWLGVTVEGRGLPAPDSLERRLPGFAHPFLCCAMLETMAGGEAARWRRLFRSLFDANAARLDSEAARRAFAEACGRWRRIADAPPDF